MNLSVSMILAAVIGLLVGGVMNVLADDLPKRRPPRLPHYPDDTPRPVSAWLGLTAFLFGQRSSPDGATLPWRHPLTELLTSGLFVLTVYAAATRGDGVPDLQLIFWLVYVAAYVLITVIDMEHKLILFNVINPLVVVAIVDALLTGANEPPVIRDALIGGAAGFVVFFILYNGGFLFTYVMGKLRGRPINEIAFGYGDVMLAGLSGLILGWQALIFAMFIAVFLGAFGAVIYLVSRQLMRGRYSMFSAIPYGPYIVIGTLLMLLFPAEVGGFLGGGFF